MGVHNKLRKDKMGDLADIDRTMDDDMASIGVSSMNDLEMNQEIPIDDPTQVVLHKEMFTEVTKDSNQIQLGTDFIDFSYGQTGRFSESKQLQCKNKFPFAIDVNWNLLNVLNKTT